MVVEVPQFSGLAQGGGHWDWPGGEQVSLPNHSQYM